MLLGVTSLALPTSEYQAVTEACGLVDRSQRGKLALSGSQTKSFLQGQVTNDVEALTPGEGCYAAFLTPKGKMLGDLRILDASGLQQVAGSASGLAGTGDAGVVQLLLDTERVALQELFNMIRRFCIGYDVQLHKRTLQSGLVSLIGPASEQAIGITELPEAEHAHVLGGLDDVRVRMIRTDLGIDLLCDADDTVRLLSQLAARGVPTVSESVAECVRIEHGRPRYGIDLDAGVIPQEAGLNERAVSFTKGCFTGQELVGRLDARGSSVPWRLVRCVGANVQRVDDVLRSKGPDGPKGVTTVVATPQGVVALGIAHRTLLDPTYLAEIDDVTVEAVQ